MLPRIVPGNETDGLVRVVSAAGRSSSRVASRPAALYSHNQGALSRKGRKRDISFGGETQVAHLAAHLYGVRSTVRHGTARA